MKQVSVLNTAWDFGKDITYEVLIENLGGYEKAKSKLRDNGSLHAERLKKALLKYRRQHNIYEVGDKVVSINSAFIEYQGVLNIDFIDKFNLMLSDDSKGFEINAICGWGEIIRHATDAEIKAGKRL